MPKGVRFLDLVSYGGQRILISGLLVTGGVLKSMKGTYMLDE